MKFLETKYTDYLQNINHCDLHPNFKKLYNTNKSDSIHDMNHSIFFGPCGVGKYSQCLRFISKYSKSKLKYEKKINILFQNKYNHNLKISDIHYEVDMSLLGCNSKSLWSEIYNHIVDVICSRKERCGIIVCKNFHSINWELLDIFYKYIHLQHKNITIKFILLTEHIGFLSDEILNICDVISFERPSKSLYKKITGCKMDFKLCNISNIKDLKINNDIFNLPYKAICDRIINIIIKSDTTIPFLLLREELYNLLIYNIEIPSFIYYTIQALFHKKYINEDNLTTLYKEINIFFHLFTNNHRPIFHLEKIIFIICDMVHNR